MKRALFLIAGVIGWTTQSTFAADAPRGSLLELHSCEVYAGGCVVSSEAPQGGRYMLRAWNFSGGQQDGADLAGLTVGLLQFSTDNLAASDSRQPGEAVVYLPESATTTQRKALLDWVKSSQPGLRHVQTRTVPMQFTKSNTGFAFSAGDFASVETGPLEACTAFSCGEELWYSPRSSTTCFTVDLNKLSRVTEPLLKMKWIDSGKRSVFIARFGDADPARNVYVTQSDICGSSKTLF